jgi:hypothetical protein
MIFAVFVGDKRRKVGDGIQCLAVSADCRAAVLSRNVDIDGLAFSVRIQLAVDTDTGKDFRYEGYCLVFRFADRVAFEVSSSP